MIPGAAFLIYATATLTGWPAQQHSAVQFPTLGICEAQALWFLAALMKPKAIAQRKRDGIEIIVKPYCTEIEPLAWINREGTR